MNLDNYIFNKKGTLKEKELFKFLLDYSFGEGLVDSRCGYCLIYLLPISIRIEFAIILECWEKCLYQTYKKGEAFKASNAMEIVSGAFNSNISSLNLYYLQNPEIYLNIFQVNIDKPFYSLVSDYINNKDLINIVCSSDREKTFKLLEKEFYEL